MGEKIKRKGKWEIEERRQVLFEFMKTQIFKQTITSQLG